MGLSRSPRDRLAMAFLASALIHLLLFAMAHLPSGGPPPSSPTPLVARLQPAPPSPEPPATKPAAPPEVIKNTLSPLKTEQLDDYIKPQPKRRVTDKPEPQPPAAKPAPAKPAAAASAAPKPAPPPEPPPIAALPEAPAAPRERRPLDLSVPAGPRAEQLSPQELSETLSRLSETILYPSDALRRGLEGEVTILVEIGEGGRILAASVASGSGHPVLDDAAVRAVRKLGSLGPSTANRTILLPVRFRII